MYTITTPMRTGAYVASGEEWGTVAYVSYGPIYKRSAYPSPAEVKLEFACPYCATLTGWLKNESPPRKCWACGAPRKN